jgi:surface antigen
VRRLLAGVAAVAALAAAAPPTAEAVTRQPLQGGPPAAQVAQSAAAYQQAKADLQATQASLARLDEQAQEAQRQSAAADQAAAEDARREADLRRRIGQMARSAYQTEGAQLSGVLEARSIGELWNAVAEARLVAARQQDTLDELRRLREADERTRDGARALVDDVSRRRADARSRLAGLESRLSGLSATVQAAGQVIAGAAGQVPAQRLPQTTGVDGQCTWYAEQAWATYSDPGSPPMTGDGADVVPNLAAATGRPVDLAPRPGALVSWQRPLLSAYGHVAYVASVDSDPSGAPTGFTVWEMNYQGPFVTDVRHVDWTGPSAGVLFLAPPHPVDPVLAALAGG